MKVGAGAGAGAGNVQDENAPPAARQRRLGGPFLFGLFVAAVCDVEQPCSQIKIPSPRSVLQSPPPPCSPRELGRLLGARARRPCRASRFRFLPRRRREFAVATLCDCVRAVVCVCALCVRIGGRGWVVVVVVLVVLVVVLVVVVLVV